MSFESDGGSYEVDDVYRCVWGAWNGCTDFLF